MEWSRDMSAGHRQRGPQEGHSTMEEGEEMRDEENEERTSRFKQHERGREKRTDDDDVQGGKGGGTTDDWEGERVRQCCWCGVHVWWVLSKLGTMNQGGRGLGGWVGGL